VVPSTTATQSTMHPHENNGNDDDQVGNSDYPWLTGLLSPGSENNLNNHT